MYLFHGLVSDKYRLWFRLHGLTDQVELDVDFENYEDWHKEIMKNFNFLARLNPGFFVISNPGNETRICIAQIIGLLKLFEMIPNSNRFPGNRTSKTQF